MADQGPIPFQPQDPESKTIDPEVVIMGDIINYLLNFEGVEPFPTAEPSNKGTKTIKSIIFSIGGRVCRAKIYDEFFSGEYRKRSVWFTQSKLSLEELEGLEWEFSKLEPNVMRRFEFLIKDAMSDLMFDYIDGEHTAGYPETSRKMLPEDPEDFSMFLEDLRKRVEDPEVEKRLVDQQIVVPPRAIQR